MIWQLATTEQFERDANRYAEKQPNIYPNPLNGPRGDEEGKVIKPVEIGGNCHPLRNLKLNEVCRLVRQCHGDIDSIWA